MIRLTKPGVVFLVIMGLFYGASWTSQSGLLLFLIGILAGCYVVNLAASWNIANSISLKVPGLVQAEEGKRTLQRWQVQNRSRSRCGFFFVQIANLTLLRVGGMSGRQAADLAPEEMPPRRGVYPLADLKISSVYPFGLVKVTRPHPLPGEVLVTPALYASPVPRASGYDAMVGGKLKGIRTTNSGANFSGVRPLQPTDSFKQIHWKSSSKGQGLMAKMYEEEVSGRIAFFLDSGLANKRDLLDDCLRAAGSMMFSSLDAGHHVEWVVLPNLAHDLVPPFSDGSGILEQLARIELDPRPWTPELMEKGLALVSGKSSIVMALTEAPPGLNDLLLELLSRGRTISLLVPDSKIMAPPSGVSLFRYGSKHVEESL